MVADEVPKPSEIGHRQRFEPETVLVHEGRFLMGDSERYEDEKPQHWISLPAYRIGRYPVTNQEYQAFIRGSGHSSPWHWRGDRYPEGAGDHPAVNVSWLDAGAYCRWLTSTTGRPYRLPTEAEWEKAASWDPNTQQKRRYPWGNDWDPNKCNSGESDQHSTTPRGQYSPAGDSAYGVADMAGNVWEWCSTLFRPYPFDPQDGREDQGSSSARVVRGGAWNLSQDLARCAYRIKLGPINLYGYLGFRVVAAPVPS